MEPADLWRRIEAQAERAKASGALRHIETDARIIEEGGIPFAVRRATQLRRKESAKERSGAQPADPFAAPEPDLFVADLSPTHYALLNKYNVLERHLLVVTHADIDQDVPLDRADFEALATCMAGQPVLGFYNGGAAGGASQRHKHLQVVRLPLTPRDAIPIERLIAGDAMPRYPVRHAFARVAEDGDIGRRAATLHSHYDALRGALGLVREPYNLLVTRDWMLLVPRRQGDFGGIPANSLAFAGALFVRDDDELARVERAGPMAVLRAVAYPKDTS